MVYKENVIGYFNRVDGEIIKCDEPLPADIELAFEEFRNKYSVDYYISDWADDDSDAGWGYCYDNSYGLYREPCRDELIIENGEIWGLCFRKSYYDTVCISLDDAGAELYSNGHNTRRYGDSTRWTLIKEVPYLKAKYIYVIIEEKDGKRAFVASDFPLGIVKACVKKIGIEDTRGHYDGRARLWLELTDEAAENIDSVIDILEALENIRVAIPVKKY